MLFSIGQAFRGLGSKAPCFAGYKKRIDRYKVEEIEAAVDVVVWSCAELRARSAAGMGFRRQHRSGDGGVRARRPGGIAVPFDQVEPIIAIGSDGMRRGVQQARHSVLAPYLKPGHRAYGSINSPMQCTMKEICAQCLQTHRDPLTGVETTVFSCSNQDQPLDHVGFDSLRGRLSQNSSQEKLTKLWVDHCPSALGTRDSSGRMPFPNTDLADAASGA